MSDENIDSSDECRDEADQFLTTFTWTCPTRSGLISAPNLYMIELRIRVPSDDPIWAPFVLVYPRLESSRRLASTGTAQGPLLRTRHPSEHVLTKDMIRCHEMSCHCVGPFYLWGNFEYWIDRQIDGEIYSLIQITRDMLLLFANKVCNF